MKRNKWIRVALPSGGGAKVRSDVSPETIPAIDAVLQAAMKQYMDAESGYTEFTPQGWPLCPRCGEDELWSNLHWTGEGDKPPIEQFIRHIVACSFCGWEQNAVCPTCKYPLYVCRCEAKAEAPATG